MISRRTARLIGEVCQKLFAYTVRRQDRIPSYPPQYFDDTTIEKDKLYDFLYDNDYPDWFCNLSQNVRARTENHAQRILKEMIMKLHTGETFNIVYPNWDSQQREQLGQRYLRDLAEDFLNSWQQVMHSELRNEVHSSITEMVRSLELDSYKFVDKRLLASESDVLNVQEEMGVLQSLYMRLNLSKQDIAFNHLNLSEEHYIAARWGDCISNARCFLECVLQEVANSYSITFRGNPLAENTYSRPVEVRNYLANEGLLEEKEKKALSEVYGLLSNTGSHPNMAQNDQARLLRQLALTLSQFVMLRFEGYLKTNQPQQTPATP